MPKFVLEKGKLTIVSDARPRRTLATHLSLEEQYSEDFMFYKPKMFAECKDFIAEKGEDSIVSVKSDIWDIHYQALFIGIIAQKYPTIEEIDFSHCELRDADVPPILVIFRECSHLKKINLSNNYISNEGALLLLDYILQHLEEIETVDLSDNDIGYPVCDFISKQIASFSTVSINLADNHNPDEVFLSQKNLNEEEQQKAHKYLGELADEFQTGDLLYGLHAGVAEDKGRNPVHEAVKKAIKPQLRHQLLIINPFSDWVINRNNFERAYKKELILFDDFAHRLTPSLYPKEDEPFIKGWSEHKIICKLGILWAKNNNKKIHYILDDLRMELFSAGNRNRADVSVTEAEIKFIARFYDNLKDTVQFWRTDKASGKLVKAEAPWLDPKTRDDWRGYLKAEKSKMRYFPQGSLPTLMFFSAISDRKSYSVKAYHEALELLLSDIVGKTDHYQINALIGKYRSLLIKADTKYKIEQLVFALADEYEQIKENFKDNNLEVLLSNLIKPSGSYSTASEDIRFFYRRGIMERVYGNKVLDMKMLFEMADTLEADTVKLGSGFD
ncbi:hypothetical protein [Legionella israelensis]|uniref:Uncharacterized protein n=1 Tax=Legionella israelensis TaxID=454 RepID=A0A0W0WNJ3_9GAMM|nr:hypothetical protein [Legionella israelensis]KTD33885.1 hypothetical protein Lisr_0253 [Legionella israelensis]QBS08948.1 hypothetical protein E4T55_03180 [Legionella israelensis]SCX81891.1 hypothetical protein SAMN02746069_00323 [Legionella israelensis DSM 19235]STX58640.1 Ran GTPase-activating protein (RanGAP) involved in mRNA processing and transport [Legionella israelensis]